ncbi:MAG: fumarylacetoacetase [Curvibacter lanceolatus]|uniref:fumarylacetoacetase n=1 Tax=Curvibacter lanceolatus TaxID=86182 RepID=UPI00037398B9|nr:fumarylacetoacetase [Curvibacter lanceolatus]MBV5293633.1 fumarylacetoacetase [Curvibacter lanceolatus]
MLLNETHDPGLQSWVASAHKADTDFPIQNLPYGVFRRQHGAEAWRGGVAIGDAILDLAALAALPDHERPLDSGAAQALQAASLPRLNALMALGPAAWRALRLALSRGLRVGAPQAAAWRACLVPQAEAEYQLPVEVGNYTDFFTSAHHALNAGRVFQPGRELLPQFKWLPIGYHGRASTVAISNTPLQRPAGQIMLPGQIRPVYAPTRQLDFELELGVLVGPGNALGQTLDLPQAEQQLFGLCLLNDWSARDIQAWEAVPLGPFMAKNFLSTVSPWVVTFEALAPFRVPLPRSADDPPPLPYLDHPVQTTQGAIDIELEALLLPAGQASALRLCQTNYRHAYWSAAQMLTQHSSNGCRLQAGDLLGTGTLSGPEPEQAACLLELTQGGRQALTLPGPTQRHWLEDGDTVVLRGWCQREGVARIGFGECRGQVVPHAPTQGPEAALNSA